MARPSGKPRRLRSSGPAYRPGAEAPGASEGEGVSAPATTCARCGLTFLGDVVVLGVEVGRSRRTHAICEPCYQSLTRWMDRSSKDGGSAGDRRSRSTDVVDALHTKRRARNARGLRRDLAGTNRRLLVSVALSVSAVAGIVLLVVVTFYLTGIGSLRVKGSAGEASLSGPGR